MYSNQIMQSRTCLVTISSWIASHSCALYMALFRDWIRSIISILALPRSPLSVALSFRHRINSSGTPVTCVANARIPMICSGKPISRVSFAGYIRPYSSFCLLLCVHSFFVDSLISFSFFTHSFFFFFFFVPKDVFRDTLWVVYPFWRRSNKFISIFLAFLFSFMKKRGLYLCIECLNTFHLLCNYGSGELWPKKLKYEKWNPLSNEWHIRRYGWKRKS
jgi:hypothetical protein